MRIKEGFQMLDVCGSHAVVAHGVKNIDFSNVINMNESAAEIWNAVIGRDFDLQDMANALTSVYEVDEATALSDAKRTASEWKEIGIIEE